MVEKEPKQEDGFEEITNTVKNSEMKQVSQFGSELEDMPDHTSLNHPFIYDYTNRWIRKEEEKIPYAFYFPNNMYGNILYGSMYTGFTDFVLTMPLATAVEIDEGFIAGELNGFTFPDDHYLLVPKTGKYLINWNISVYTDGTTQEMRAGVMVNGSVDATGGSGKMTCSTVNKPVNTGSTGIMSLDKDDQISLYLLNWDGINGINVVSANMTIIWISN